MKLFLLIQDLGIEEKIKNAPDNSYQIVIAIATYLPFALLIGVAYLLYYMAKKRKNLDKN